MTAFENVRFCGSFRDYQARVLANADRHLSDGKINIVAAPGSGKTVLGLELIRRIGRPCLIFSPTTAIREQWADRFRELFLEDPSLYGELFSTDLRHIRPMTSLTYQALFTAMEKIDLEEDSYADVDILQEIREQGIGTLCLDEAHHLKNEWQKALEKLISMVGSQVKIIALTATPPYDSEGNEWSRYLALCGEVDEEIFVPELVARDTLCPHQDYIYFNYPTAEETAVLQAYRENVRQAIEAAGQLDSLTALSRRIQGQSDTDKLYSSAKEYIALLVLFEHYGWPISQRQLRSLTGTDHLPRFQVRYAETAFRFLLDSDLLTDAEKEELAALFKHYGLYQKRKLELVLHDRLKRTLISSVGKLSSIRKIAESEVAALGPALRMLVLTDYIKKEALSQLSAESSFHDISIVSIFETLRRALPQVPMGVLSGSLVILPDAVVPVGSRCTPLIGTGYSTVDIPGSTLAAVKAVGQLFTEGRIQILIGTKSLLGEGWDAPCINSLIMASFVGSYVLSNQMRGRAIRIDKSDPQKTANIWHLVTVEPEYLFAESPLSQAKAHLAQDTQQLLSYDYEVLQRRFDAFMGPGYDGSTIESGIQRISVIHPPYTPEGIARINETMLARSQDRKAMQQSWDSQVKAGSFAVVVEAEADREARVPVFTFFNLAWLMTLALLEMVCIQAFVQSLTSGISLGFGLPLFALCSGLIFFGGYGVAKRLLLHRNPARSIETLGRAVYDTMTACGLLEPSAKIRTEAAQDTVRLYLTNASIHDQNRFHAAMAELLSPIENPRYILIRHSRLGYRHRYAFACPSILGKKKEYVELLAKKLKTTTGNYVPVYTRTESGRSFILKCRRKAYITENHRLMNGKFKVRRWE